MNWIILTFLAIIFRAIYSLGTRRLSRDAIVSPITLSFLLTASTGLLILLFNPLLGGLDFSGVKSNVMILALIVITSVVGNIVYFAGQKKLDAGVTQIIFSSILIWGGILSVLFLQSTFSTQQVIGMIILLTAIIMVQCKKGSVSVNKSALYIVLSAMLFALFQVGSAHVSTSIHVAAYLLITSLGTALTILCTSFNTIKKDYVALKTHFKGTVTNLFVASGTSSLYMMFAFLAYKNAPDKGVVVVLLTSQVILSVLFGIVFLKERENIKVKIIAGVLALIAGILIKS
ncbi:MAG: DMT family transporter [Candidatus Roizmanbacteria bacterium]|nr:DMT family transporter [Candidatus Roizmanbacteria bacterium]